MLSIFAYRIAEKGIENGLPWQSCAADVAFMAGIVGVQELTAYVFHRTGHHKLERLVRFYSIGMNTKGLVESKQCKAM